jgi:hypothetical protein
MAGGSTNSIHAPYTRVSSAMGTKQQEKGSLPRAIKRNPHICNLLMLYPAM